MASAVSLVGIYGWGGQRLVALIGILRTFPDSWKTKTCPTAFGDVTTDEIWKILPKRGCLRSITSTTPAAPPSTSLKGGSRYEFE